MVEFLSTTILHRFVNYVKCKNSLWFAKKRCVGACRKKGTKKITKRSFHFYASEMQMQAKCIVPFRYFVAKI